MSKEMTVIALGVWVAVVPYLGVPGSWRTVILVLSGLAIAAAGFLLRGEAIARGGARASGSYVESAGADATAHEDPERITSLN